MNNKIIILNAALVMCLVLIDCACDSTDSELKDRINKYYRLEQEHKWEETYYFRTPEFKKSIPIDMYAAGMRKFVEGWTLQEFEIKKVRYSRQKSLAEVEICFKELNASKGDSINTQMTTWEKIDGVWYGKDVGDRQYLFLNSELKLERY